MYFQIINIHHQGKKKRSALEKFLDILYLPPRYRERVFICLHKDMHSNDQKKKQLIAFKKARSLLDKIITMAEKDEYCINIVQQNLAVIGLLKNINLQLLDGHLNCCFVDAVKANDKKRMNTMIDEILTIVKTAQNK